MRPLVLVGRDASPAIVSFSTGLLQDSSKPSQSQTNDDRGGMESVHSRIALTHALWRPSWLILPLPRRAMSVLLKRRDLI